MENLAVKNFVCFTFINVIPGEVLPQFDPSLLSVAQMDQQLLSQV